MHTVLLKFGANKSMAAKFMEGHNSWIAKGFSDSVFQCVGSLDVGGGFILVHGEETETLHRRVNEDPFVVHGVVTAEIHHIDIKRTVPNLDFLTADI